jgi:hypothetical protein
MIIKNNKGREFFIRVVMKGDRYGLKDCLIHTENNPMIEFYDYTFSNHDHFGPRGQFVSRYYAETIAAIKDRGLTLQGYEPLWTIDQKALKPVIKLASDLFRP